MEEHIHDADTVHAGEHLVSWEVDEYPRHQRSTRWYVLAALIATACIVYAIWSANFLFAVIILLLGVIMLLSTFREPERVDMIITTDGFVIGTAFYEFRSLKDFAIIYDPPVKNLYVTFQAAWRPLLTIPLEDTDPNLVRDALLPYLKEDLTRTGETLTDVLQRVYKL